MKTQALAVPAARTSSRALDFLALAKPRLNFLVVVTATVGYYVGAGEAIDLAVMFHTICGTALVAGASAALNQVYERDTDALMRRTRTRPLPDGRMVPAEARWFAAVLGMLGLLQLAVGANPLAALVALATLVSYVAIYTPLKRHTPLSTMIGAVPGALPPLIGWAAARGSLGPAAWVLFGIVFLWQIPHFLAIAWLYRDEYERAGMPLLPVIHPDGRSTGQQVVLHAAALLPLSLAPTLLGLAGPIYFSFALLMGVAFLGLAAAFARRRTLATARALFLGSIAYLPLLWAVLVADRVPGLIR